MNQIPQDIIDKILEAVSIVDVIGEDITLKKQGVNYIGLCPFHDDKTPSMVVSPTKGIYKCFACGAGGNVFKFLMEHRNMTYPEAVREMGAKYHIDVPTIELTPEQQQEFERQIIRYVFWVEHALRKKVHELRKQTGLSLSEGIIS